MISTVPWVRSPDAVWLASLVGLSQAEIKVLAGAAVRLRSQLLDGRIRLLATVGLRSHCVASYRSGSLRAPAGAHSSLPYGLVYSSFLLQGQ